MDATPFFATGVGAFGITLIFVVSWLVKIKAIGERSFVHLLTLIVLATLVVFLIVIGFSSKPIDMTITMLGAYAGYVLGFVNHSPSPTAPPHPPSAPVP